MAGSFTEREFGAALVERLAKTLEAAVGGLFAAAPGTVASGDGWTSTLTAAGARRGTFAVWVDRAGAAAIARLILGSEDAPDDRAVADALREMWSQAAGAVSQMPAFTGMTLTVTEPAAALTPQGSVFEFAIGLAAAGAAQVSVCGVFDVTQAAAEDRSNLDLVMDIELPLTVRFGRTIMTLKALADLGPGSVVDMGRSPDDPVELLISDRLVARGEVVVVGGKYGVRVTDLVTTGNKPRSVEI